VENAIDFICNSGPILFADTKILMLEVGKDVLQSVAEQVFFCQVDVELFHGFHDFSGAILASLAISDEAEDLAIAVHPNSSKKVNSGKSGDPSDHEAISAFGNLEINGFDQICRENGILSNVLTRQLAGYSENGKSEICGECSRGEL